MISMAHPCDETPPWQDVVTEAETPPDLDSPLRRVIPTWSCFEIGHPIPHPGPITQNWGRTWIAENVVSY